MGGLDVAPQTFAPPPYSRPVSLSDLESLDSEFHQSMVWLKENEIDNGSNGDNGDLSSGMWMIAIIRELMSFTTITFHESIRKLYKI